MKKRLYQIMCISILLILSSTTFSQQGTTPLTYDEIISLLSKKVDGNEICKQIKTVKVSFKLTTQQISKLVKSGASDNLLSCIESNVIVDKPFEAAIVITSPQRGEECGTNLQVSGTAKIIPGKHLWLFAHRRGLAKWWPQSGEIIVEENGEWVQGAYIGQHQDIGFDFEIKAIWLDEATHSQVSQTLSTWEAQNSWPGMTLPAGEPVATVVVKKARD